MIKPVLFGFVVGCILSFVCMVLAGAGHGSYALLYTYFAPLAILERMDWCNFAPAFFGGPFMYAAYGAILYWARKSGRGFLIFHAIVLLNFVCIGVMFKEVARAQWLWEAGIELARPFLVGSMLIYIFSIAIAIVYLMNPTTKKAKS